MGSASIINGDRSWRICTHPARASRDPSSPKTERDCRSTANFNIAPHRQPGRTDRRAVLFDLVRHEALKYSVERRSGGTTNAPASSNCFCTAVSSIAATVASCSFWMIVRRRALGEQEAEPGRGFESRQTLLLRDLRSGSIGARWLVRTAIALTGLPSIGGIAEAINVQI